MAGRAQRAVGGALALALLALAADGAVAQGTTDLGLPPASGSQNPVLPPPSGSQNPVLPPPSGGRPRPAELREEIKGSSTYCGAYRGSR